MSSRLVAAAALLLLAPGCAFDDGQPWGEVDVQLTAATPMAFRTADGVAVELERVEVQVDSVALFGAGVDAADFDPANPPEGCTFCHNGHCHCGDDLVDYEVLAARAAGAGEDAAPVRVISGAAEATRLGATPVAVPLADCPDCSVPRGALRRLEVTVSGLRLIGRAANRDFDFDFDLNLLAPISVGVDVPFDRGEAVEADFDLELTLPRALLDGVWDDAGPVADPAAAITDNLIRFAEIAVAIRRL